MADSTTVSSDHYYDMQELKQKYLKRAHNLVKGKKRTRMRAAHNSSWSPLTSTPYDTRTVSLHSPYEAPLSNDYHSQVNKELKRLLLASVGSDLQEQLDGLVRDKSHLKYSLDIAMNHLMECTEEMDELSVEADIWRSKVLASRVLIGELTACKVKQSTDYRNCITSIETLLRERQQLTRSIVKCHQMLMSIGSVLLHHNSPSYNGVLPVATVNPVQLLSNSQGCTVLELTDNMTATTKMISDKINELSGHHPSPTSTQQSSLPVPGQLSLTQGEILSHNILYPHPVVTTPTTPTVPHLSFGEQNLLQQRRKLHPPPLINCDDTNNRHYCRTCNGSKTIII